MIKVSIITVALVAIVGTGAVFWITSGRNAPSEQGREFFSPPQDYDISGGQEMRPRWNEQKGAGADAASD